MASSPNRKSLADLLLIFPSDVLLTSSLGGHRKVLAQSANCQHHKSNAIWFNVDMSSAKSLSKRSALIAS